MSKHLLPLVLAWCMDRAVVSVVHGSGGGAEGLGDVGDHPPELRMPILAFKLNQDRRHRIPRQQRKVTNWPAYDASLRQPAPACASAAA